MLVLGIGALMGFPWHLLGVAVVIATVIIGALAWAGNRRPMGLLMLTAAIAGAVSLTGS